jgi:hypothetical protein
MGERLPLQSARAKFVVGWSEYKPTISELVNGIDGR